MREWYQVADERQWDALACLAAAAFLLLVGTKYATRGTPETSGRWLWLVPMDATKFTPRHRRVLHYAVCLPFRASLAVLVWSLPRFGLHLLVRALACLPFTQAVFWAFQSVANTIPVGQFGGPAWWAGQRFVHALCFLACALVAVVRPFDAYAALVVDVCLSLGFAIRHDVPLGVKLACPRPCATWPCGDAGGGRPRPEERKGAAQRRVTHI